MADTAIRARQMVKSIFAPERTEPAGSPAMAGFLRGLVITQSYAIGLLLLFTILVSTVFADTTTHYLVVLDRTGFPTKVERLLALDSPNLTRTAITNKAMHIATQVLSYGFNNADARLLAAQQLFTPEAWKEFVHANLEAGKLDVLKTRQQILSTVARKGAVIVSEGYDPVKENYRWVVQVPVISSYLAGSDSLPRKIVLTLTFIRMPTDQYKEGVAIDGWKESPG